MERPIRFRCLAGLLAAGGAFMGFASSRAGDALRDPMNLVLFIVPNGMLIVAFIIRCVCFPPNAYRRALWRASAIVHGAWLAGTCAIVGLMALTLKGTLQVGYFGVLWCAWLILAVVLSFYGLRYDDSRAA